MGRAGGALGDPAPIVSNEGGDNENRSRHDTEQGETERGVNEDSDESESERVEDLISKMDAALSATCSTSASTLAEAHDASDVRCVPDRETSVNGTTTDTAHCTRARAGDFVYQCARRLERARHAANSASRVEQGQLGAVRAAVDALVSSLQRQPGTAANVGTGNVAPDVTAILRPPAAAESLRAAEAAKRAVDAELEPMLSNIKDRKRTVESTGGAVAAERRALVATLLQRRPHE
eukprot:g1136.t1